MNFPLAFDRKLLKGLLPQAAMYLMLGTAIGFLFFYDMFYYYCAPLNSNMPSWLLILALGFMGMIASYLYSDIIHVMVSTVLLPLLGAMFCFLLFISPAFSPDIIGAFSDSFFELARYIIFDMILASIVIFSSGFLSLYVFETD
jgi:hypothetical protein